MIQKLAFRNVFRNRRRSLAIVLTIAVGLWGITLSNAFWDGMVNQMIQNGIGSEVGHIQIHRAGFQRNMHIKRHLQHTPELLAKLGTISGVGEFTTRLKSRGLIRSAEKSAIILLDGVNPQEESQFTTIASKIEQGRYLETGDKNKVVIGSKLANKLGVGIGDKVVVMLQDIKGDFASCAFRVCGIYRTGFTEFDSGFAYFTISSFQALLSMPNSFTDLAIKVDDLANLELIVASLRAEFTEDAGYEVLSWQQMLKPLVQIQEVMDISIAISYGIIFIIIGVALINTLLMSLFERIKEFGIMMAIGTRPIQIFGLIVSECFYLAIGGLVLGGVLTYLTSYYFMQNGLDLSHWAAGMEFSGLNSIVYPLYRPFTIMIAAVTLFATTLLVSLYPAIKAARLKPVAAINFI